MNFTIIFILISAGATLMMPNTKPHEWPENIKPPVAEEKPVELTHHDHTRIDNYFWLRERDNPEVVDYLKAENEYLEKMMAPTAELRENLVTEMRGRMKEDDQSVPYRLDDYYYYTRYDEGKEYPIYCRRYGSMGGTEEIIVDANKLAEGKQFFAMTEIRISRDQDIAAFAVDTVGRRFYSIMFKDLRTGKILDYTIPDVTGNLRWANDNKSVFYTKQDPETLRSHRIYRHTLGSSPEEDKLIYEEEDVTFRVIVSSTKSREYIIITSGSTLTTEQRVLSANNPTGAFSIIHPRERELEYYIEHYGDHFYIRTNQNAPNFKLMKTPLTKTGKENWEEVIPHREEVMLTRVEVFNDYLVVGERSEGLPKIRIIEWATGNGHYIDFDEPTYTAAISFNPEFDTKYLRFVYSSLTTPSSTFEYSMEKRLRVLLKRAEVLGDFEPENYITERLFATANDGTRIPISVVYREGTLRDGSNPLLIHGYGSYGASSHPFFNSIRLSLLDRGFVYAIAHVRGGQEMGREWYEQGKLLEKKNTFTDFIACTEYLIEEGFSRPERVFASGGSAGGLLVGAVTNMRPDLYRGIVAHVPFVDVVSTMLDESIPLTTAEYDEWGNPNEKKYYEYMLSYSPYDNVTEQEFPNMLITSGLHDSQVQYWEPTKWAAKLREKNQGDSVILLYTNMEAGHGGATGRFRRLEEVALEYAFLLFLAGIDG